MSLFNIFKEPIKAPPVTKTSFVQQIEKAGLLVTTELNKALEECQAKVTRISRDCRMMNRKHRDTEFDLENDRQRCLHGLSGPESCGPDSFSSINYTPSDVQRVTQIFDKPKFFIDGASSSDIVQGGIGDCWFVSALATMATAEGLVEKFCVARDEEVGVYGFIFFRDASWVTVIIDDFLYTSIPKYEELNSAEKILYHNSKDTYNSTARKGGKGLYFARSGTPGETWVPLIEKAYAKLHGSYAALSGGDACEAIEDLTGGVSTFIPANDIFNIDRFWNEELLKANQDRLFGCSYQGLDTSRSGDFDAKISGLIGNHAYSVLRAVEVKGKRFVVVRNPWGQSEWTGPWSDGSKEWTKEWLDLLPEIGHSFGNDGQFVMEYKDFLESWEMLDRTLLFDSSWIMSFQWLHVTTKPLPTAWTFGDVSFTFSLPKASPAMIVLSQLDTRFFEEISGRYFWTFEFVVFKKGEKEYLAHSGPSRVWRRSVNLEVNLEAGDYVAHVRLDRHTRSPSRESDYIQTQSTNWDQRTYARMLSERTKAQSVAANFKSDSEKSLLPLPLSVLAGQDLSELEKKALAIAETKKKEEAEKAKQAEEAKQKAEAEAVKVEEEKAKKKAEEEAARKKAEDDKVTTVTTEDGSTTTTTTTIVQKIITVTKKLVNGEEVSETKEDVVSDKDALTNTEGLNGVVAPGVEAVITVPSVPPVTVTVDSATQPDPKRDQVDVSEENSIFLGFRVYTNKEAPVVIEGQLRHEMEVSAALALAS
ncbi:cysteine proteinase [Lentinula edodes]|nr:cysteine proteinase [Lentinula edodes]